MSRPLVALALAFGLLALPSAADARSCAPQKLKFARTPGSTAGRLSWRAPKRTPRGARYRIWRDRKVVGQTRRRSIRVRVSVNRRFRLRVRLVTRRGRLTGCAAMLRLRVPYRLPSKPRYLAGRDLGGPMVKLSWEASKAGEARVRGYRVLRDDRVYRQTSSTGMRVRVASKRRYRFTVVAVDRNGYVSARSNPVTLVTGHTGPAAPATLSASAVSDSDVALSWAQARIKRGSIRGYRPKRDGKILGQTRATQMRASNLFASTNYRFEVQAVDTLGYVSPPSPTAWARTQDPVPTAGHAHAFLLASTGRSFADFRAHYRSIGTVYPTYFDCDGAVKLTGRDDPLVTRWSLQRRIRVLPRFNCQSGARLHRMLNEPQLRQYWLDQIVDTVARNGYDGAMLDFEAGLAQDRDAYSSFVTELSSRLHGQGHQLAIAVSSKTVDIPNHPRSSFFDYLRLSEGADTVFVMGWGIHWTTSAPGAQDSLSWLGGVVAYISTMPHKQKFVLGMLLYGMDWPSGGGTAHPGKPFEYEDVLALRSRQGATATFDPSEDAYHFTYTDGAVSHDVWYTDTATQATRIELAHAAGMGGVGFWRLGREDQRLWNNPRLAPGVAW
jgi:spore germination protein YaaH/chitodextrinase